MMEGGFLLILLAAAVADSPRARPGAALAAIAIGLLTAGLRAGNGIGAPVSTMPTGFVSSEAAFLVVGLGLAVVAGAALGRTGGAREGISGLLLFAGSAIVLWTGFPLLAAASPGVGLFAAGIVIAAGGAALAVGRVTAIGVWVPASAWPRPALAALFLATVAVLFGAHLGVVLTGVVLAALAGFRLQRLDGSGRVPIVPVVELAIVPLTWWLLSTIAGPEGLGMTRLAELPISPAAERLLAPLLILGGWVLSGLWPWHRQGRGVITALPGMALVARVVLPAMPDGLAHWRALAVPLVVAGLWHAVLARRWPAAAVAMGWIGLLGGGNTGVAAAALAAAGGLLLEVAPGLGGRLPVVRSGSVLAGAGALLAVEGGLATEVVYSVVAVLAMVAGVGRATASQAMTPSAPNATVPNA